MVISIEADILKIVMLTTCADALLRVSSTRRCVGTGGGAEKNRHKLIHPRIGKEEIR